MDRQEEKLDVLEAKADRQEGKLDRLEEKADKQELGANFTWSRLKKGNINAEVTYLHVNFKGDRNTYLGYLLLDALQPGNNVRFNLNWQQSLRKGLQLTMQYFGRKSENTRLISSGNIQLTAFF